MVHFSSGWRCLLPETLYPLGHLFTLFSISLGMLRRSRKSLIEIGYMLGLHDLFVSRNHTQGVNFVALLITHGNVAAKN